MRNSTHEKDNNMNKKMMIAAAAALLVAAGAQAQDVSPKRELRGVWISTHISLDWPNRNHTPEQQRAALLNILEHNKATGMNAAFLQVRSQSDAMYPSTIEPWSYYLTNNQGSAPAPFWDPLQFAIDETRKRGMEFHAWVNPYRAVATASNQGNTAMYAANHISRTHPEWLLTVGTVKILNPGLPQVRDYITSVVMDIVNRYDIDGLHFDDYFYPTPTSGILDDAAYNADPRGFPNTVAGRADWRRDNINLLISRLGESIRAAKPWVKFGVSPSGIYRSSTDPALGSPTSAGASQHYSSAFADTRKWLQEGWVDYLAPQVYWYMGQAGSDYSLLVPWWNQNNFGRHMYIGLADYKMGTTGFGADQIAKQIGMNRAHGNIAGQIHFRHAFLAQNTLNYRTELVNGTYKRPALVPTMAWKDGRAPGAPSALAAAVGEGGNVVLSWSAPAEGGDELDKVRRFAVYRAAERDIDIENAGNLLAVTNLGETSFTDRTTGGGYYYYTVTALNRLSTESAPAAVATNDHEPPMVRTRDASVTLAGGAAAIGAADVDNGSSDNWGIESLSVSRSTFSCSDIGTARVQLTATDKGGSTASGEATVNVQGIVPKPAITASAAMIALGYGSQSVQLSASDSAGSSAPLFTWSPAEGLSTAEGPVTAFTASAAGLFSFTAKVGNENGCYGSATITVPVIDARCGDDKVSVCQKTGNGKQHQICISSNAVEAHLRKGDSLGACTN